MYTRFYDNTTVTRLVKQLVATANVPFVSTWKPGDFAIRGMVYLSADQLWRCNHTGYPKDLNDTCTTSEHTTILDGECDPNIYDGTNVEIRYFHRISPYVFGEQYFNITGAYKSNILGYDSTTHYYLGQYLRMMRDVYSLNLMPFYNCFDGTYIYDIDFDSDSNVYEAKESFYKIYSVPVKFGKTYTVGIDSSLPVEMMCVIYGPKGIIKDKTENLNNRLFQSAGNTTDDKSRTYRKYQATSLQKPITYETKSWHQVYNDYVRQTNGTLIADVDDKQLLDDSAYDQGLGQFEKYLRLLIKVPRSNKSSLVVLEGDYSIDPYFESANTNNVTWTNQSCIDLTVNSKTVTGEWIRPKYYSSSCKEHGQAAPLIPEPPMFSPLSLLQMSDGNHYAFSNRLVEYLLQHAINHLDAFSKNIQRIQEYSKSFENRQKNHSYYAGYTTPGVWDDGLKEYLFELVRNSKVIQHKVDLTGYVDKDTEQVITRGQKV